MNDESSIRPIITLTTDFGLEDEYVGTLKGVILGICREAAIVDLTHSIAPQDVTLAAMSISHSSRFFPSGTIHVVVVDPGVGSDRRILVLRASDQLFIAPDNGVLTPFLHEKRFQEAYHLNNEKLYGETVSTTFHGRDIMAPIAAKLALGMEASQVGTRLSRQDCLRIILPKASVKDGRITGQVIHIDHFGNLQTSIAAEDLAGLNPLEARILICGHTIESISSTYADAKEGGILALIDSRGHLEVATAGGSAAITLGCRLGETVTVQAVSAPLIL